MTRRMLLFIVLITQGNLFAVESMIAVGPSFSCYKTGKHSAYSAGFDCTLALYHADSFKINWSGIWQGSESTFNIPSLPAYWLGGGAFALRDNGTTHYKNFYAEGGLYYFVNIGIGNAFFEHRYKKQNTYLFLGVPIPVAFTDERVFYGEPYCRLHFRKKFSTDAGLLIKTVL
jgi:hypothetical protein